MATRDRICRCQPAMPSSSGSDPADATRGGNGLGRGRHHGPAALLLLLILTLTRQIPHADGFVSTAEAVTTVEDLQAALASGVSSVTVDAPEPEEELPGNALMPMLFFAPAAQGPGVTAAKTVPSAEDQEEHQEQPALADEEGLQHSEAYFPPVAGQSTRLVCGMLGGQRCLLSGQGRGQRAFVVQAGGRLHLEGFRLSGWSAPEGGALRVDSGGHVTLINCTFDNNNAGAAGSLTTSEIGFSWGQTWSQSYSGGAILITGGTVEAESVEFVSNTAAVAGSASDTGELEGFGGAVALVGPGATLSCVDCAFSGNFAGAMGGAVAATGGARVALQGGVLSSNKAVLGGGAVASLSGSTIELSSLAAAHNSASSGAGGAAAAEGHGTLLLVSNCRLVSNRAGGLGLGGAVALSSGAVGHLSECSVGLNSADQRGGALSLESGAALSLVGTAVTGNFAVVGGGVDAHGVGTELEVNPGCDFEGNEARISGGHLSVREGARVVAKGARLATGLAGKMGGAIYVAKGGALVGAGLLLEDNEAFRDGGGLGGALLLDGGMAVLESGAMLANRAAVGGAACVLTGGQLVLYGGVSGPLEMQDNLASSDQPGSSLVVVGATIVADGVAVDPRGSSWSLPPVLLKDGAVAMLADVSFGNVSDWTAADSADIFVDDAGADAALLQLSPFASSRAPNVTYTSGAVSPPTACAPLICAAASPFGTFTDACSPALSDEKSSQLLLAGSGCPLPQQRLLVGLLPELTSAPAGDCLSFPAESLCPGVVTFVEDSPCPGSSHCNSPSGSPPPPPHPVASPPPPPADDLDGITDGGDGFLEQENTAPVPGDSDIPWQTPGAPPAPTPPTGTAGGLPPPESSPPTPLPPPEPEVAADGSVAGLAPSDGLLPPSSTPPAPPEDSTGTPEPDQPVVEQPDPVLVGVITAAMLSIFVFMALATCCVCRLRRRAAAGANSDAEGLRKGSAAVAMTPIGAKYRLASTDPYNTRGSSPDQTYSTSSSSPSRSSDAGGLRGLRSCYGFFPCARSVADEVLDSGRRLAGAGSAYAFRGGAPPPPSAHLQARQPALPNLVAVSGTFGRRDVHVTLPARLATLLLPAGSPRGRFPSPDSSPASSTAPVRRDSCPDLMACDLSGQDGQLRASWQSSGRPEDISRGLPGLTPGGGRLPAPISDLQHSAVHRTIATDGPRRPLHLEASALMSGANDGMPPDGREVARTPSPAPAGSGLSEQEWALSGLVEVDFATEIQPNLIRQIGSGAFGDVYLAKWRGRDVAVKIFNRGFGGATADQAESFRQEVLMMTRLGHGCRQIVSIYGACFQQPHMALIYQYIPGGTLYDRIHDSKRPPLSHLEVLRIGRDLASGLAYLHPYVAHRDLKPMNILLDEDGTAMLIDFGVSRERDPSHSYFNTKAGGTPAYMAPEMFNGDKFSEKVDVYAVACILCECLSREAPWSDQTNFGMIVYAVSLMDERPEVPPSCPERLQRLIARCWHRDPHSRPSCYEIMHKLSAMIREEEQRRAAVAERLAREQDVALGAQVRRNLSESSPNKDLETHRHRSLQQHANNNGF